MRTYKHMDEINKPKKGRPAGKKVERHFKNLGIPTPIYGELKIVASRRGHNMNTLILLYIEEGLKRETK